MSPKLSIVLKNKSCKFLQKVKRKGNETSQLLTLTYHAIMQ